MWTVEHRHRLFSAHCSSGILTQGLRLSEDGNQLTPVRLIFAVSVHFPFSEDEFRVSDFGKFASRLRLGDKVVFLLGDCGNIDKTT